MSSQTNRKRRLRLAAAINRVLLSGLKGIGRYAPCLQSAMQRLQMPRLGVRFNGVVPSVPRPKSGCKMFLR